jgi:hypothetical protein
MTSHIPVLATSAPQGDAMRPYSLVIIAVVALAAGGALAADAVFDVVSEAAVTAPPYPTAPIEMRLGGPRHGTVITIHGLNFRSLSAGSGGGGGGGAGGEPLPVSCVARPGGEGWADEAFFDITYVSAVGGPDFAIDSFFDIFTEYRAPDGSPCPLAPINDGFAADDWRRYFDLSFTDTTFDLSYQVQFNPREYTLVRAHGEAAPGLRIFGATVQQPLQNCASGCEARFALRIDIHADDPSGCCPITRPVLIMREIAQSNESPVAGEEQSWGDVKALFR